MKTINREKNPGLRPLPPSDSVIPLPDTSRGGGASSVPDLVLWTFPETSSPVDPSSGSFPSLAAVGDCCVCSWSHLIGCLCLVIIVVVCCRSGVGVGDCPTSEKRIPARNGLGPRTSGDAVGGRGPGRGAEGAAGRRGVAPVTAARDGRSGRACSGGDCGVGLRGTFAGVPGEDGGVGLEDWR